MGVGGSGSAAPVPEGHTVMPEVHGGRGTRWERYRAELLCKAFFAKAAISATRVSNPASSNHVLMFAVEPVQKEAFVAIKTT